MDSGETGNDGRFEGPARGTKVGGGGFRAERMGAGKGEGVRRKYSEFSTLISRSRTACGRKCFEQSFNRV